MLATTKSKILNKSWQSLLLSGLICAQLSACGGGGSDPINSSNAQNTVLANSNTNLSATQQTTLSNSPSNSSLTIEEITSKFELTVNITDSYNALTPIRYTSLAYYGTTDQTYWNSTQDITLKFYRSIDGGKNFEYFSLTPMWTPTIFMDTDKNLDCLGLMNLQYYAEICRGDSCVETKHVPVTKVFSSNASRTSCFFNENRTVALGLTADNNDPYLITKIQISKPDSNGVWSESISYSGNWRNIDKPIINDDQSTIALYASANLALQSSNNPEQLNGSVYIFESKLGTWQQSNSITVLPDEWWGDWRSETYINSNARISLNASGNTLAIGLPSTSSGVPSLFDPTTVHSGSVQIWQKDLSGNWAQEATLKASNAEAYDLFGSTLILSADGNTLAVNAPWEFPQGGCTHNGCFSNDDVLHLRQNNSKKGAGYIFKRTGTTWQQAAYLAKQTKVNDGISWTEHFFSMSIDQTATQLKVGPFSGSNTDSSVTSPENIYFTYQLNNGVWTLTE